MTSPTVTFRCRKCKARKHMTKEEWLAGGEPELCCGQKMIYHGEDKKRIEVTERK